MDRRTSAGGCDTPGLSDPSDSLDGVDAPDDDTLMGSSREPREPKDFPPAPPRPALTAQTSPDRGRAGMDHGALEEIGRASCRERV